MTQSGGAPDIAYKNIKEMSTIYFNKRIISSIMIIVIATMLIFGSGSSNEIVAQEQEFRGIWVSTVWGIDYPSKATTDEETLKNDAIRILNNVDDMGFNTIFLQVRSCSDAIYNSKIFPWSKYITGTQGLAPKNNFDPLKFFIEEAHKRGIELHAWINPYRVTASPSDNDKLSVNNPAVLHPELTVLHTDGKIYLNPGEPKARELIIDGIKEILNNYDVDGIHLDDYFYPGKEFNDSATFAKYGGAFSNIADWRINNNNLLIKEINETVHKIKPKAKFGVSPAGIWANKKTSPFGSDTDGWGTYENQFADSRLWVKEGYVDYILPQIYWPIGYRIADYEKLVLWWSDVVKNTNVKLYIGQAAYKTADAKVNSEWYGGAEILKQIELNRKSSKIDGYCMFSYKSFINCNNLRESIKSANKAEIIVPPDLSKDYQYYYMKYELSQDENEDYIVMYYDNNGKREILPRSRYAEGEVTGLSNKTGSFGVMYNEPNFDDIKEHPQEKNLKYMASRNIIIGYKGSFKPSLNIKRADFVLMLMRMLEIKNIENLSSFDDTNTNDYYYKELATAKRLGLIQGVGNNRFAPEKEVTRQDIFVMTFRAMDALGMINNKTNTALQNIYDDYNLISSYAAEAISFFTENEILEGINGNINPVKIADRGEIADFLATLLKSDIMMKLN